MRIAAVVLLLAATVIAGEEPEKGPLDRLRSDAPGEQAWGAYLAGRNDVADAIPRLVDLIRTVPGPKEKERCLVVRAAFDALIRLKASVPPKLLEPHLTSRFQVQALILLASQQRVDPELLLRLYDRYATEMMGTTGIAFGNLLARERVPGFAPRLLRHVEMKLVVTVVDEGWSGSGGGRRIGGRSGDGRLDVPEGFPPTVFYHLTDRERPGAVMLADGPRPVRWYRIERTGRKLGFGSSSSAVDRKELIREWLARLIGVEVKDLGIPEHSSRSLRFADAEACAADIAAFRDKLLSRYWKLVAALVEKNLLSLAEARALRPSVALTVKDERKDKTTKLPAIPEPQKRPKLPGEEPETR